MHRTTLIFVDVDGAQKAVELPLLRLSDRIKLSLQCQRKNRGRSEVLDVQGEFRVTSVEMDASSGRLRQVLQVEAMGLAPTWKAVKGTKETRFGPARYPRTPIS